MMGRDQSPDLLWRNLLGPEVPMEVRLQELLDSTLRKTYLSWALNDATTRRTDRREAL